MGVHLLILEDDNFCLDLLETALTAEGHIVSVCQSPEDVLVLSRRFPDAIALVDFWGRSQLTLKEDERSDFLRLASAVPTILLTSRHWAEKCRPEELGVLAIIPKPFDIEMLYSTVVACAGRDQARLLRSEPNHGAGGSAQPKPHVSQ